MMSPRWLMLYPGACLVAVGIAAELAILHGPIVIDGVGFDIHTMLYAAGATILGTQLVLFSLLARAVGVLKNLLPMSKALERFLKVFTIERGILLGAELGACASGGVGSGNHDARGDPLGHLDAGGCRDCFRVFSAWIRRCPAYPRE
jgi:hypothetical protein